jgi:hypothetical protein
MQIFTALSLLPVFAGVIHAQDASAIISELTPLITQLSAIIQAEASPIISELSQLIQAIAPTGVVSDLPAVLSTNIPFIDSIIIDLITSGVPPGAIPTDIAAEIPAIVSQGVSVVISDIDDILAQLPGTLSDAALPSLLASYIPIIGSEVQAAATSLLPELGSLLATALPGSTPAAASGNSTKTASGSGSIVTSASVTATTSASATTSKPQFTGGAAERVGWGMQVAAVVGFAAIVAAL